MVDWCHVVIPSWFRSVWTGRKRFYLKRFIFSRRNPFVVQVSLDLISTERRAAQSVVIPSWFRSVWTEYFTRKQLAKKLSRNPFVVQVSLDYLWIQNNERTRAGRNPFVVQVSLDKKGMKMKVYLSNAFGRNPFVVQVSLDGEKMEITHETGSCRNPFVVQVSLD